MDQQKRLLVAIALSFGLTLVWTELFWKPQAEAEAAALAAKLDAGVDVDGGVLAAANVPAPVLEAPKPVPMLDADGGVVLDADGGVVYVTPPPQVVAAPEAPLRTLELARSTTKYAFSTEGAGLTSAELTGEREREEKSLSIPDGWRKLFGAKFDPPPHMNLARAVPGVGPNLGVSVTGASPVSAQARYAVTEEAPGKVSFTTRQGAWEITKTFTWKDAPSSDTDPTGYLSQLSVTVKNVSAGMVTGELAVHALRAITPESEQAPSMFGGIGNQASVLCGVGDDVTRKIPPGEPGLFSCGGAPQYEEEKKGPLHFVGIDQQYFLTAVWPLDGAVEGRCLANARPTQRGAALMLPLALNAGESVTRRFGVFLGPKDLTLLQHVSTTPLVDGVPAPFDPRLEKTVDFGLWAVICKLLIAMLRFFFGLVGNWGVAIILLTVTVKLLLVPLTHKSMVNAEKMKSMQPKIDEIRKKYPDDQVKQIEEMRKAGIDPMANLTGCLPLLVQLPIWAALFTTLRTSYELYGEPFFGVWSNLTSKDPTYLLPLALGVTMLLTQRLQPQMSMDKTQQILLTWVMPVFFTAIMMNYPAGLALYIFTNNLLSIVQQFALRRYLKSQGQLTAPAAGAAK